MDLQIIILSIHTKEYLHLVFVPSDREVAAEERKKTYKVW